MNYEKIYSKPVAKIVVLTMLVMVMMMSIAFIQPTFAESEISNQKIVGQERTLTVKLTNTGGNYIKLYYYFKPVNNWNLGLIHDSVDCKLDVEGNDINCTYYLEFFFNGADSAYKVVENNSGGNNNYWTTYGPYSKCSSVLIKGWVKLGVEKITVNVDLDF